MLAWNSQTNLDNRLEREKMKVELFNKTYDGDSICDLSRDIHEIFNPEITPAIKSVKSDKNGIHKGSFSVVVKWCEK